jgi:hypothetical protein
MYDQSNGRKEVVLGAMSGGKFLFACHCDPGHGFRITELVKLAVEYKGIELLLFVRTMVTTSEA